jgi:hypothetical protein
VVLARVDLDDVVERRAGLVERSHRGRRAVGARPVHDHPVAGLAVRRLAPRPQAARRRDREHRVPADRDRAHRIAGRPVAPAVAGKGSVDRTGVAGVDRLADREARTVLADAVGAPDDAAARVHALVRAGETDEAGRTAARAEIAVERADPDAARRIDEAAGAERAVAAHLALGTAAADAAHERRRAVAAPGARIAEDETCFAAGEQREREDERSEDHAR